MPEWAIENFETSRIESPYLNYMLLFLIEMGTNIGAILELRETSLDALAGKIIAVDAYNMLYQFLTIIRQPDGTPLRDSAGRVTSHLSGLIYRTTNLMAKGLKLVFVFDGKPSELKAEVIRARSVRRAEARRRWASAKVPEEALKFAKASTRIEPGIVEEAKELLEYLGIPYVQAPSEGEAQAAFMVRRGDADIVASQDYDSLLFGAPEMVRNLSAPRRGVKLELAVLSDIEHRLGITHEELVEIAILVGTDFNPGIKGIGAKRALKLIREHHSIDELLAKSVIENAPGIANYELVRDIFLHPEVDTEYELRWSEPEEEKVKEFLCELHDFSEERVNKALERIRTTSSNSKEIVKESQRRIDQWL